MSITFACPRCKQSLTRADGEAGWKTSCPSCGQKLKIPQPQPAQPTDRTMLGQLQGGDDNRTALGELPAQPAPPTAITTSPSPLSNDDPWSFSDSEDTTSGRRNRHRSDGGVLKWLKAGGLLIGSLIALWIGGALVLSLGHLPKKKNTEAEARQKLKKALDCWIAGDKKQKISAKHPDIDFVDPDLGDGYILLRHDIRSGWEGPDGWLVKVDMVFRDKVGGEVRLTREYEVRPPSEKGVTSIHVALAEFGPRKKTHE